MAAPSVTEHEHAERQPVRLPADAAFEAEEEVGPIHRRQSFRCLVVEQAAAQSLSSSLMLVLERVRSSTRLTMTAQ